MVDRARSISRFRGTLLLLLTLLAEVSSSKDDGGGYNGMNLGRVVGTAFHERHSPASLLSMITFCSASFDLCSPGSEESLYII